ncbi:hypothetical protein AAVH_17899 [Aphelenchoides avenae]|nr:hypothetical protein AAVH_17899 [Aphelenchus avenae]
MTTISKSFQGIENAVNAFIVLNTQHYGLSVDSVYPGINVAVHFILKWGIIVALALDGCFLVNAVWSDYKNGHWLPRNTLISLANIAGSIVGSRCIGLQVGTNVGHVVGSSFTQNATVIATCTGVGSVIGIVVGAFVIGDICGSLMAAICDDIKDARYGRFNWNIATAAIKLTCKWVGCLGGGYDNALLGDAIGATFGIVWLISGGAVGGILGAALGYFGERYTGDRVNECAKKVAKGVKQIASCAKAKFVATGNAARSRLSVAATDSKGNKPVDA